MTRVTSQALDKSYGKELQKRCIFRWLRKTGKDDTDVTWSGRSFQVLAVATGKAQLPTVDSRVRKTGSDVVSADCRRVLSVSQVYTYAAAVLHFLANKDSY